MKPSILNPNLRRKAYGVLPICLSVLMLFTAQQSFAQPKKERPDKKVKIEALRKAYINEKLALTEAEQKAFWPLYTEYKQKEKALRDSFHKKYKPNDVVFMNDKQAEEYLNAGIKLREDQNNLYKTYIEKFKKVLPVKKVAMLPMVEREFKKTLMDKARPPHKKGPPPGMGPDHGPDED